MTVIKAACRAVAVTTTATPLALAAQGALAAPALTTGNVNLRQGPGTSFPVITLIPAGSQVEVAFCRGQWCSETWQGQSGTLQ